MVLRIDDAGPGIAEPERDLVLKRFYRSERSLRSDGNRLGLALVAAVARLHDFDLLLGDNLPGCSIEIRAPAASHDGEVRPANPAMRGIGAYYAAASVQAPEAGG